MQSVVQATCADTGGVGGKGEERQQIVFAARDTATGGAAQEPAGGRAIYNADWYRHIRQKQEIGDGMLKAHTAERTEQRDLAGSMLKCLPNRQFGIRLILLRRCAHYPAYRRNTGIIFF